MLCLPVKNIFQGEDASAALFAVMKERIAKRADNVAIVYCAVGLSATEFRASLGLGPIPKDVYAVVHPDSVYNLIENILSRPRVEEPTKTPIPAPAVLLYVDLPEEVRLNPWLTGPNWQLTVIHPHLHNAMHLATEIHMVAKPPSITW